MARTEAEGTEPEAIPTTHPVYASGRRSGLDHLVVLRPREVGVARICAADLAASHVPRLLSVHTRSEARWLDKYKLMHRIPTLAQPTRSVHVAGRAQAPRRRSRAKTRVGGP